MDEPWTGVYDTPNKSIRQNVARRGVVLHHAAMTNLNELIRLEMGAKELSSTVVCKDDQLLLMMPLDTYRAWSLSDAYWDSALRSVETCNESIDGWTISDASHWSLASAVAYFAERDGFWPHRDGEPTGWTVLGHREVYTIHGGSYATACPGGMDIDLTTKRAQGILRGEKGFLMALSDEQQSELYEAAMLTKQWMHDQVFGWSPDTQRTIITIGNAIISAVNGVRVGETTDEQIESLARSLSTSLGDELATKLADKLSSRLAE